MDSKGAAAAAMGREEPRKYAVKFKRNRSSKACEVCHSRKVRCDATLHIPCTNCLTFGCECKFPEPRERKNARKRADQPVVKIEGDKVPASLPNPPVTKRRNEPLAAISARSARIDTQRLSSQSLPAFSYHGSSSSAVLITDKLGRDVQLRINDFVPPHLRRSIAETRAGLDTVQMEILRLRGAFHLPEKSLCDDLVKDFFEIVHPMEPIIDKTLFLKEYEDGSVSLLLLQAVLLGASRVSLNPLILDGEGSNYLTSSTFYQRAKALYDAGFENDEVAIVQSLLLFSRFWDGIEDITGNAFYWTHVAVSVAQGYGFHRNTGNLAHRSTEFPIEKLNITKVLWWALYMKDVSVAVAFGRPRIIQLEDCDVPMLRIEDFGAGVSKEDAQVYIQMIRLSEIMSIVLQEQYSVRAVQRKRHTDQLVMVITHCDMIMSSWMNGLPHSLQYSPSKQFSLTVNVLNLYYYYALCLIHRSSMVHTATLNGKQYPSEGIVFRASRIIADIGSKLLKSGDIRHCHPLTIPIFFIASMTFICHMDSRNVGIAKSARLGYSICTDALKILGRNYLVAVLIYHSLENCANDEKKRAKLVASLSRKNDGQQSNAAPTPGQTPIPSQQEGPPTPIFQSQPQQPDLFPKPMVESIPALGFTPQDTDQSASQQDQQASMGFPDLYLFTSTAPTHPTNEFDPSELFPTSNVHRAKSETSYSESNTDSFQSLDFPLTLAEFDLQGFTNGLNMQNSLNTLIGDEVSPQPSNIYSFVN